MSGADAWAMLLPGYGVRSAHLPAIGAGLPPFMVPVPAFMLVVPPCMVSASIYGVATPPLMASVCPASSCARSAAMHGVGAPWYTWITGKLTRITGNGGSYARCAAQGVGTAVRRVRQGRVEPADHLGLVSPSLSLLSTRVFVCVYVVLSLVCVCVSLSVSRSGGRTLSLAV
eukprot:3823916-Rhodomonas_salina.2